MDEVSADEYLSSSKLVDEEKAAELAKESQQIADSLVFQGVLRRYT